MEVDARKAVEFRSLSGNAGFVMGKSIFPLRSSPQSNGDKLFFFFFFTRRAKLGKIKMLRTVIFFISCV